MTHNAIYFIWAIWLARKHAIMLVWLRPSFTSECVQTLFFDKATDSYRLTIYYSYIITTMYLHNHTLLSVPALNIICIICLICNSIIISPMPRIWTMARAPTKQNPLNEHPFFIYIFYLVCLFLYPSSLTNCPHQHQSQPWNIATTSTHAYHTKWTVLSVQPLWLYTSVWSHVYIPTSLHHGHPVSPNLFTITPGNHGEQGINVPVNPNPSRIKQLIPVRPSPNYSLTIDTNPHITIPSSNNPISGKW